MSAKCWAHTVAGLNGAEVCLCGHLVMAHTLAGHPPVMTACVPCDMQEQMERFNASVLATPSDVAECVLGIHDLGIIPPSRLSLVDRLAKEGIVVGNEPLRLGDVVTFDDDPTEFAVYDFRKGVAWLKNAEGGVSHIVIDEARHGAERKTATWRGNLRQPWVSAASSRPTFDRRTSAEPAS